MNGGVLQNHEKGNTNPQQMPGQSYPIQKINYELY